MDAPGLTRSAGGFGTDSSGPVAGAGFDRGTRSVTEATRSLPEGRGRGA
ncbi:hypothetical protein PJI17_21325 [Mycobacterium kansasii]